MTNKLTKLQRKLLKYINKNPNILFDSLQKHFNLSKNNLMDNLEILRDLGYLEKDTNFRGFVYPTINGKNYFEFERLYWYELIVKSVFCPIIVAFVTTLITLWLKGSL